MFGALILGTALVVVTVVGLLWRHVQGRFTAPADRTEQRGPAPDASANAAPGAAPAFPADVGELGQRATLVQFSSAFCAPCRTTRVLLSDVAARTPGVRYVEVDAEQHLDLVRRVGVRRTPTTFVLDSEGRVVTRASGAPTRTAVLAAVQAASRSAGQAD